MLDNGFELSTYLPDANDSSQLHFQAKAKFFPVNLKLPFCFLPMSKESPWPSSTSLRVYTHASLQFSGNGVENRNDNNVITTHAPPIHIHGRWRVESPNHPFSHYDYIKPQTLSFQNPFHALSHCVLLGLFMHT